MAWAVRLSSVVCDVVAPYAETWTFRQYFCTNIMSFYEFYFATAGSQTIKHTVKYTKKRNRYVGLYKRKNQLWQKTKILEIRIEKRNQKHLMTKSCLY